MGKINDTMAVVDTALKVRGIKGLRVWKSKSWNDIREKYTETERIFFCHR